VADLRIEFEGLRDAISKNATFLLQQGQQ